MGMVSCVDTCTTLTISFGCVEQEITAQIFTDRMAPKQDEYPYLPALTSMATPLHQLVSTCSTAHTVLPKASVFGSL